MNRKLFRKYIKSLPKNAKVLDAGCSIGNNSRYVHKIRPDLDIYGVDIDASPKNKLPDYVKFFNMSITDLKHFKDNYFDCILCFYVLEHLHKPAKAVSEFHRVLKKNGIIFAESPHWISTIVPLGYNFYDDPGHIRPYNKKSFKGLFEQFSIKYLAFETPIFFYLANLYNLNKFSLGYLFRKLLKIFGLYATAVFIIAIKK